MDTNEKLGWVERVNHASEEQAKRTLNFMILKCNTKTDTIARAIRDAIERHTPTPTIVYQQPESEDDGEAELASSHKKSSKKKKKKKDQDGSSQDEDDAPSTTSKQRRGTRRGDINPDPLVGQLILKKTKAKLRPTKRRSSDHEAEQAQPGPLKKNQSKHASKQRADPKQRPCDKSMGTPSNQEGPPVIDLVTSSDDETCDTEQSENESVDEQSCHNSTSDSESSEDDGSDNNNSDHEEFENQQRDAAFPEAVDPLRQGTSKKANQTNATQSHGGHNAAPPSTVFKAKVSNQSNGIEISLPNLGKKRKAPERTGEEVHDDQPTKSATVVHLNKKYKQHHPQEPQKPSEDRKCQKCGVLFPSVAQLLKHRVHCKGSAATPGSHHRSEPPPDDHFRQFKQAQGASTRAGDSIIDEPRNTLKLPSRPRPRTTTDQGLSEPPAIGANGPKNFPHAPAPSPSVVTRQKSNINPSAQNRPVSSRSLDGPPHHQVQHSEPKSLKERLLQEVRGQAVHRCKDCKKRFKECENSNTACCCHPGMLRIIPLRETL